MYRAVNDPSNVKEENTVNNREPEPLLDEVRWAVSKLKKGKSPGIDNIITAVLIKEGGEASARFYHHCAIYLPHPKKGILNYKPTTGINPYYP